MNLRNCKTIDVSPDSLWAILATDYNNIGDWTTAVLHSDIDTAIEEAGQRSPVPR